MASKPRVLFLEAQPAAMAQLQNEFASLRHYWDLDFADNAPAAMTKIQTGPSYEAVVVDIALQADDPIRIFTALSTGHPRTVRFALTDRADDDRITRSSSLAHQFVYSPCESHTLRAQLTRALSLREKLSACPLRHKLHSMNALPPLPQLYMDVLREMHSDDPSMARVAEIIAKDVSMSAKLLQVVNSAGVGLRREVTSVAQAASLLGLQRISAMVLVAEVFGLLGGKPMPKGFSPDALWRHSLIVGEYAKKITQAETADVRSAETAFTSGLLHDLGLILVAIHMPDQLSDALAIARDKNMCLLEAELETLGATHAEVGGYLLELWGLPDAIVEAITFHDFPSHMPQEDYETHTAPLEFSPLTSVHVANYFCESDQRSHYGCPEAELDREYLEKAQLLDRIEAWWKLCSEDETLSRR
jgi:HD-like signal output (HDOD) protein